MRWNALDGQVIGSAAADANGNFSVKGAVPADALPAVYSVIAVSGQSGVGRAAFEVTAPLGTTATPSLTGADGVNGADSGLWKGFTAGGGGLDSPSATDLPVRLGLGVLAVGLVALAGGAAVAATRRRRVRNPVPSRLTRLGHVPETLPAEEQPRPSTGSPYALRFEVPQVRFGGQLYW